MNEADRPMHLVGTRVLVSPATVSTRATLTVNTKEGVVVNIYLTADAEAELRQGLEKGQGA